MALLLDEVTWHALLANFSMMMLTLTDMLSVLLQLIEPHASGGLSHQQVSIAMHVLTYTHIIK